MILVDLQKALDALYHTALLQKMEFIGFKQSVIRCFQWYFSSRKSFVTPKIVFSDAGLINCSVPQGFTLGSLLFLMYINHLPQALNETGLYLYADDTYIFFQYEDVKKVEEVLNKEILSLCEWFIDHKLSIYFGDDKKKQCFLSGMKSPPKRSISYGNYCLKQHNIVRYLRCYLNSNLNGELLACRVLINKLTQS